MRSPVVSEPDVLTGDSRRRASLTLGPWHSSVPCGRAYAVACLSEWGLTGARDSAALVVSELLTNAVIASEALEGLPCPVQLWLRADDTQLLIMVGDGSRLAPVSQAPADDQEGGRALLLVQEMSTRWGWFRFQGGKVVWALVAAPS